jgi:hypothetical protein
VTAAWAAWAAWTSDPVPGVSAPGIEIDDESGPSGPLFCVRCGKSCDIGSAGDSNFHADPQSKPDVAALPKNRRREMMLVLARSVVTIDSDGHFWANFEAQSYFG